MSFIGNLLWIIICGLELFLAWIGEGIFLCCTIIGIPWGIQCFKIAVLSLVPFGKEVTYNNTGALGLIGNIIWILCGGLGLWITNVILGIICFCTIIGIPFGKQCFKLAKISLMPFGATF